VKGSDSVALYDCHCHLQDAAFDADREAVIERARKAGVRRVLAVCEDLADAQRVLELADRQPDFVRPALGVHPDRAPEVSDEEVAEVEALIRRHAARLAAIGEVGLDYRPCWDEQARARQIEVLRLMVRLSTELGLPLSVHSRSAGRHAIEILQQEGSTAACLHGFDGRAVHGERGAEAGYLFSIPPSVVRSRVKQKLVPRLPESCLLLESDSPVLGPSADERNEPANLSFGLAELARLRGASIEPLAATIAGNTRRLFPRLVG
jgi:TatD DNase family protein